MKVKLRLSYTCKGCGKKAIVKVPADWAGLPENRRVFVCDKCIVKRAGEEELKRKGQATLF